MPADPEATRRETAAERAEDEAHLTKVEVEFGAAERMTFFSDAVVAIALTLLALELPVPKGNTNAELLHYMHDHLMEYLAFFISFSVIGAHWVGHHTLFRWLRRLGGRLLRFNLLWLLMMVLIPFATKMLTEDTESGFFVQFGAYALVQTVASVLFGLMAWQMSRHDLLRPGAPPMVLTNSYRRAAVMAVAFGLSIPVALVGWPAYLVWFLIPIGERFVTAAGKRRTATA
ncbi:MAG TPA: TMEM175 family protein [Actinocatenispora sp.]